MTGSQALRLLVLLLATAAAGCKSPEVAKKDMLRRARVACEKGDGASCFQSAQLYAEGNDPARSLTFYGKGCAAKHAGSCDGLHAHRGPERATLLANACNAGDLPSCTRLADGYPSDPAGQQRARALNEQVCKAGTSAAASPRDLLGAAFACGKLSRVHAKTDPAAAAKLDALSTMMLTESLFRLEKQQDADVEAEIANPPKSALDKDRAQRDVDNARQRHAALLAALDGGDAKGGPASDPGGPGSGTPLNGIEQAFLGTVVLTVPPANGGAVITDDAAHCKETGDAVSCTLAASQAEAKGDAAGALDLHVAGCARKPDSCWSLITYAEIALRKKDPARAQTILEKGCDAKSANACIRLATEMELGERGINLDTTKAAKLLDKACEAGGARACMSVSTMAEDGRGIAKNAAKAKTYKTKGEAADVSPKRASSGPEIAADEDACRRSRSFDRCEAAAAALQDTDAVKAEELYRMSCAINKGACGLWGFAVDRLRRDDAARGNRILQQGCDEGSGRACLVLGELTHLGYRSIARAEVPAASLYQKACELGDPHSCRVIAARYRSAKNAAKADELRDKAAKIEDGEPADRWAQALADRRKGAAAAGAAQPAAGGDVGKARAEWKALADKARARAQVRMQHLESAYAGRKTPAAPPFTPEDIDASAARTASIKRVADSVFASSKGSPTPPPASNPAPK